jgi:membrane protease YdiL (CAAX protease family)
MNDSLTLSINKSNTHLFNSNKRGHLVGILAVFVPFVVVALIGDSLGTDTSLASGLVINLAYLLAIAIATVVLKLQGRGWQDIGLARPASWPRTILMSLGALLAMITALIVFQIILMNIPGLQPSDQSDYNPLTGNLPLFLTMVVGAWTLVAFGEEMLFRAFLIISLGGLFRDFKARWALALVGSSLLFGLGHYDWGIAGIIETIIAGLILGSIYLRTGRNLWVTIIAHGFINTLKFSLVYAGLV